MDKSVTTKLTREQVLTLFSNLKRFPPASSGEGASETDFWEELYQAFKQRMRLEREGQY